MDVRFWDIVLSKLVSMKCIADILRKFCLLKHVSGLQILMSALILKIGVLAATTWLTTSFTSITSSKKDAAGEQASPKGNFTLQLEDLWPLKFKICHWWESLIISHFTLHYDIWVQVPKGPRKFEWIITYTESYIAWIGYCLMVYWILHQAHLKEVTLTQNWETMTIQNLTTLDFLELIMWKGPQE